MSNSPLPTVYMGAKWGILLKPALLLALRPFLYNGGGAVVGSRFSGELVGKHMLVDSLSKHVRLICYCDAYFMKSLLSLGSNISPWGIGTPKAILISCIA